MASNTDSQAPTTGPAATPAAGPAAGPAAAGPTTGSDSTPAASAPKPAPQKAPLRAPPGYKLVKVKNPDGKIITVKKKLTPEELAAEAKKGESGTSANAAAKDDAEKVTYKIVSIPQPDGTLVRVKRPIKPADATQKAGPASNKTKSTGTTSETGGSTTTTSKTVTKSSSTTTEIKKQDVSRDATKAAADSSPKSSTSTAVASSEKKETSVTVTSVRTTESSDEEKQAASKEKSTEVVLEDKAGTGEKQLSVEEQLAEQRHRHRMGRTRKFRHAFVTGLASVVGKSMPTIELDHNGFQPDDIMLSDDDSDFSMSDDDHDDHHHSNDHDDDRHSIDAGNNSRGHDHSGVKIQTGSIATGLAAAATSQKQANPPPPYSTQKGGDKAKQPASEKVTYKVTEKDKEMLDNQHLEQPASALRHHWEDFSFYVMASLSIVLPTMFVVLGAVMPAMNGQSTSSNWNKVPDAIDVAISAWPIVFAAVVAQCFKSWATYRVERGIRLRQLEQLVGSNSFASAMKQPILLRRLDLLTLAIFITWCLSPIGSQSLVHMYSIKWKEVTSPTTIYYLNRNGDNAAFTRNAYDSTSDPQYGALLEEVALYFQAQFTPTPASGSNFEMDSWNHPLVPIPFDAWNATFSSDTSELYNIPVFSSQYGVPFLIEQSLFYQNPEEPTNIPTLPKGLKGAINAPMSERLNFTMDSSYFSFQCSNWTNMTAADFANTDLGLYSEGGSEFTFFLLFDSSVPGGTPDTLKFAALNLADNPSADPYAVLTGKTAGFYSYIECPFKQVFLTMNVTCQLDENSYNNGRTYQCTTYSDDGDSTTRTIESDTRTSFKDFSSDFQEAASPNTMLNKTISPFERYLVSGTTADRMFSWAPGETDPADVGEVNATINDATWYRMSTNVPPAGFAAYFSALFNGWMAAGYCPGRCMNLQPYAWVYASKDRGAFFREYGIDLGGADADANNKSSSWVKVADAQWSRSSDQVFSINQPFMAVYWVCTFVLLIAGAVSVIIESRTVAPDVLGYVSTVARNSRYLHLPATTPAMSGPEKARVVGDTRVMMQDAKKDASVGKIVLGLKKDDSEPLRFDRVYR